jgi:DNA-binding response OmpR family regulator
VGGTRAILASLISAALAERIDMHTRDQDRVLILGQRLHRAHAIMKATVSELMAILATLPRTSQHGPIANLLGSSPESQAQFNRPIVDMVAMTVTWRGQRCPLGYTRLLDLIDRLVRSPGRWLPYDRLLREVWEDDMLGEGAIKVAITRLKDKLKRHRMRGLAQMIHTSGYRCGYFPDGLPKW